MKQRTTENGSRNDDWETPDFIKEWVRKRFGEFFDPCPIRSQFDGLQRDWGPVNYVNPPYTLRLKTAFIEKSLEEADKGKIVVLLIPASTETKTFQKLWKRASAIYFVHKRVAFKGWNTRGEYVTNKCGQGGSMIVVLEPQRYGDRPNVDVIKQSQMAVK